MLTTTTVLYYNSINIIQKYFYKPLLLIYCISPYSLVLKCSEILVYSLGGKNDINHNTVHVLLEYDSFSVLVT